MEFKLAISNPEKGKTYKFELKGSDAEKLIGKKIKDKFNGVLVGASGYEMEITGGSDKSGFPMLPSILGQGRKTPILSGGRGFKPKRKGHRKRKTVVGNTISDSIAQINCKIVKKGKEDIDKILGGQKEEEKKEKPKEEQKVEEKPEPEKEIPKEDVKVEEKQEEVKSEEAKSEEKESTK